MSPESTKTAGLSEVIAENFGANATYVESLLARWRSDPALVDESWRAYFSELVGNGAAADSHPKDRVAPSSKTDEDRAATTAQQRDGNKAATATARATTVEPKASPAVEATPIRGAALKIVENMEASLSVPTATSQRRIPVKL